MKKGLILGRFQPFHLGHLRLIEAVKDNNLEPMICISRLNEEGTDFREVPAVPFRTLEVDRGS